MSRIFLLLLVIFPFFAISSIYSLDKNYFLCPINYKSDIVIRSDSRGNGVFAAPRNGGRTHRGIDLFAEVGTLVLAAKSGRVVCAQSNPGMGKYVIIRHAGGLITLYGHLDSISVKKGQRLRQGEVIGRVGKTGNARGKAILPHLHFEVRKKGEYCDPMQFL